MFGKLFKKENEQENVPVCTCGGACGQDENVAHEASADAAENLVVVMGTGCKKCHQLYENALEAASKLPQNIQVEYVTDIEKIAAAGVMSTPALLVNGTVVSSGKLLSSDDIKEILR